MGTRATILLTLAVSALSFFAVSTFAASNTTEVYLANVRIQADILAMSDRLAATRARSAALKRFAEAQATHQGAVAAALDSWRARAEGATPAQVASLPVRTGRSVAIDAPADETTYAPPGVGVLMAGASTMLDHMAALDGAAFDVDFKTTQRNVLKTLEGLYESYANAGDDAALREMAAMELARVRAEIAALDKA